MNKLTVVPEIKSLVSMLGKIVENQYKAALAIDSDYWYEQAKQELEKGE